VSKNFTDTLIDVLKHSIEGFKANFMNKKNFQQEISLALFLIIVSFIISETTIQKILLISSILIMVIVDFFNHNVLPAVEGFSFNNLKSVSRIKNITKILVYFAIINLISTWLFVLFT
jgi:diacylglycerol kinase (ATP)